MTLTSPGDQANSEGNSVSLQLSATEANNSTLSYQASGLPSGLSINGTTGLISGTVSSGDSANAPYTVTVMATDTQGNGSHTYSAAGNYTITATISDDGGNSATATNSASVTAGSSSAPVANNDSYSLNHDTTFSVDAAAGVLANDTDPNNLPLSAVLVGGPSDGSLNLNSNGSFTYTPNAGYTGSDSFTYYATDGQQNSNTATVSLNVQDTGTISTQPGSYSVAQGQVLSVDASTGVLANASDSDGDSLSATLASGPSNGSLQFNNDGSFTYTPNAGYVGNDSFTYTASDGVQSSMPTPVNITVTNTAPTAINQTYGIPENTTVNVTAASGLLNGASDTDGDTLTASAVNQPSHGSVTVHPDGSFAYTPTTGYTGSDSFTYAVSDGAASTQATVTLNVHADSSTPTAGPASYSVQHDQTLTETAAQGVLASASDSDGDPLTASLVSGPSNGTVQLNPDGSFVYTPNAGFTGSDSFQYDASDGATTSTPATVTISVTNTGAPVANAVSYSVERNNTFSADATTGVLANDTDSDGDTLTASLVGAPTNGTLTLNSDGSFDYTPNTNFTGSDSFTYTASDGVSTSAPATVTLTVSASPPQTNDDTYYLLQNTTLNVPANGVLANDSDPDNLPITAQVETLPSNGSLTFNSDGSFSYTPQSNFTGTDSFTYEASDGGLTSAPATVTVNVFASDSPPTTKSQQYTVSHNGDLTISGPGVLAGALDPNGQPLTAVLDSDVQDGYLTLNPDGSFDYAPDWNFIGDDSFSFHASDGLANSVSTTVTIHVTDQAPILNTPAPSFTVAENGSLSEDQPVLLSGAYDANGDDMMTALVSSTTNGTLALQQDGTFTYEPNTAFVGTDSFSYEITDGILSSNPITVNLQVQPGSPFQLDGRDAGSGSRWMDDTEADNAGIYVSATDPNPAALLAHTTGNSNYQRIITWDPTLLSITTGGSSGSSGSLTLNESDGNVQLTVVPVGQFAPGETSTISMAVKDTQTGQQVANVNVKAAGQKAQITLLTFTSDQGVMHKGNLKSNGDLLGGVFRPFPRDGKPAENDPISQEMDKPIEVTLTLTGKGIAANTPYLLTGTGTTKALTFSSPLGPNYATLTAAGQNVTASASAPAPGSIGLIQGSITWTLTLNPGNQQMEQNIPLGRTGTHRIYAVLGTPNQTPTGVLVDGTVHDDPTKQQNRINPALNRTNQPVNPAAVTAARMNLTIETVSAAIAALKKSGVNNPAPSQIIMQVLTKLGNFSLNGSTELTGVGAWGVPRAKRAQCISMAEFTALVAWMIGVPGTVTDKTYFALPNNPKKALVGTLYKPQDWPKGFVPNLALGQAKCIIWPIKITARTVRLEVQAVSIISRLRWCIPTPILRANLKPLTCRRELQLHWFGIARTIFCTFSVPWLSLTL